MAESKIWARYYRNLGRYNLCSNEKSWCLTLQTSDGNFSETWPKDEEPEVDGMLPSEVLDVIEVRLRAAWISSGREETLERMAKWKERAREYDQAWLLVKIEAIDKSRAELVSLLESVRMELSVETAVEE